MERLEVLRGQARRRYELSRLRRALLSASPLIALVLISFAFPGDASWRLLAGAGLFGVAVASVWRGGTTERMVPVAAAAGLIPFLLPLVSHACASGSCGPACVIACAVGGLSAGAVIGRSAARQGDVRALAYGLALAGLAGSLGCTCIGVSGFVGLAGGLAAGAAPLLLWRDRLVGPPGASG